MRYLDRLQPLALLILRLVLGIILVAHGSRKVFGGLSHHVQLVSSLGLPGWYAYLSAAAEFFGGILVIAGILTRFASLAILIDMIVAIWKVHSSGGYMAVHNYEFPLTLLTACFALATVTHRIQQQNSRRAAA